MTNAKTAINFFQNSPSTSSPPWALPHDIDAMRTTNLRASFTFRPSAPPIFSFSPFSNFSSSSSSLSLSSSIFTSSMPALFFKNLSLTEANGFVPISATISFPGQWWTPQEPWDTSWRAYIARILKCLVLQLPPSPLSAASADWLSDHSTLEKSPITSSKTTEVDSPKVNPSMISSSSLSAVLSEITVCLELFLHHHHHTSMAFPTLRWKGGVGVDVHLQRWCCPLLEHNPLVNGVKKVSSNLITNLTTILGDFVTRAPIFETTNIKSGRLRVTTQRSSPTTFWAALTSVTPTSSSSSDIFATSSLETGIFLLFTSSASFFNTCGM